MAAMKELSILLDEAVELSARLSDNPRMGDELRLRDDAVALVHALSALTLHS